MVNQQSYRVANQSYTLESEVRKYVFFKTTDSAAVIIQLNKKTFQFCNLKALFFLFFLLTSQVLPALSVV